MDTKLVPGVRAYACAYVHTHARSTTSRLRACIATPTHRKFACMASTESDTALLLDSEELDLTEKISLVDEKEEEDDAALLDVSTPCSVSRRRRFLGSELVVAVFVVAFDTKKGEGERLEYYPEAR